MKKNTLLFGYCNFIPMKKIFFLLIILSIFSCNRKPKHVPKIETFISSFLKSSGNTWETNSVVNDFLNANFMRSLRIKLNKYPQLIDDMPLTIGETRKINDSTYTVSLYAYGVQSVDNKFIYNVDVIAVINSIQYVTLNTKQKVFLNGNYVGMPGENNRSSVPHGKIYSRDANINNNNPSIIEVTTGAMVFETKSISEAGSAASLIKP